MQSRIFLWIGLITLSFVLAACASDEHPTQRTVKIADDGWQTATLASVTNSPELAEQMLKAIEAGEYTGISAIVLAHQGKLIVEEYFGDFGKDDLHSTRSASKAITSALVGIAIDKGFLSGSDLSALSFFPEYDGKIENWDDQKSDVTIHHLLSMTSGVRGNEDAMYPTDDWIKFYFDQPLVADPGQKFSYATSGIVVLGNIITRASEKRVPAFANEYLFEPLGILSYKWPITNSRGNQGLAMTGGGLHLRPRDMAKFGQLYLQRGVWDGQQILSEDWIEASTSKQATSDLYGEDFGYLWRMIDREINGVPIRSYEAWGNGGQFIMVFPEYELVAAFTGENYGKFPEMEQPFQLMERYLLPMMMDPSKQR